MPAHDTQATRVTPSTSFAAGYSPAKLDHLERRAFTAPFVLVAGDNAGCGTVTTRAEARRAVTAQPEVATIAGTLVSGLWAVDVDPADTGADPDAGAAIGEELTAWCEGHGLPWLLRASGRAGGHHVLARVPAELLRELRQLCRQLTDRHGPACTPRRTLRLLTAPHRAGLDAPVLAGTLTAADLPQQVAEAGPGAVAAGRTARRRVRGRRSAADDRSAREFGDAVVRARAGWGPGRAWAQANVPGSKAAESGELWWRRYVWCVAVTIVAAEDELSEPQAWARFQRASPARARQLGLETWRECYWQPALTEAGDEARARRRHFERRPAGQVVPLRSPEQLTDQQRETALFADALHAAGEHQAQLAGLRPQFAHSVAAAAHALAEPIVTRHGSISTREWAERAQLDPKTLRKARDFLAERGVLYRAARYQDGPDDTDAWLPGPAAAAEIERRRETSPTRWYTPIAEPAPLGHASPTRLHRAHRAERQAWRLRCAQAAEAARTGTVFAEQQTPAAKTARSLWHQRQWWQRLTPDEQEARRRERRAILGAMHRSERCAWFDWLARRDVFAAAADRAVVGESSANDWSVLERAPRTVHLGMRDPRWRTGGTPAGTPSVAGEQLALVAA